MANLVLTTACNRRCAYCFADRDEAAGAASGARPGEMGMDAALAALDWVAASGRSEIRLLGGEPTLHPRFPDILQAALARGLDALVFSNGLMPDAALAALADAPADRCRVMLNLNVGEEAADGDRERSSRAAATLGRRAFVGVNIHRPGLPLAEAVEFAAAHGLRKVVRVGLAHPRPDGGNRWLHPRDYRRVGGELELFLRRVQPDGYALNLDCGFVPCMFGEGFFEMAGLGAAEVGCRCGPIPDVLPDLTAIHCFPLGALDQLPVSGVGTVAEMNGLLQGRLRVFQGVGVFKECARCPLLSDGRCRGGCLATARLRLRTRRAATVPPPATATAHGRRGAAPPPTGCGEEPPGAAAAKTWSIPYIDQPAEFWEGLVAEHGAALREAYFPIGLEGVGSGRPLQPGRHLEGVLRSGVLPMAVLVNPVVLPRPLREIGGRILDEVRRLHDEYGVRNLTVGDVRLAERIKASLPDVRLAASCLQEVAEPAQARLLGGLFDVLVPSTRLLRHPGRLAALRASFGGRLRLIVNEGCLDPCFDRKQHFFEMAGAAGGGAPRSLCEPRLAREPWLRLTGGWILPQHLHLLDAVADQYKLAGRVTLGDPARYRKVLRAYVRRLALWPHEIGGGPASVLARQPVPLEHFQVMASCDHLCADCGYCRRAAACG
ncbi:MAG: radical SAM protein [Acidobacteriota bacterium]|jgi:MoaA/NifB/PqqE/SkfB family radical SAM enzyme|nr:radical SAM protein [Acidobacteriota bacterium]